MTIKKKHHIIPRFYLEAFVDPTASDKNAQTPFTPGVWLIDKELALEPRLKGPRGLLRRTHFYRLKDDDPERVVIEEVLGKVESEYASVIRRFTKSRDPSASEYRAIALFVGTLLSRTEWQVSHVQATISDLERLYRQVDRAANKSEKFSDEFWVGSDETGKKMILPQGEIVSDNLLKIGLHLVFNKTELPFVTSDNPVTYRFLHLDEVAKMVPVVWIRRDMAINQRKLFCFCALTPRRAVLSSPFLQSLKPDSYEITRPQDALRLNLVAHDNAEATLISACRDPFGPWQDLMRDLVLVAKATPKSGPLARFYTDSTRYDLPVTYYDTGCGEHPLQFRLIFKTRLVDRLPRIASETPIRETYVIEDGEEMVKLSRGVFVQVAISAAGETILESSL